MITQVKKHSLKVTAAVMGVAMMSSKAAYALDTGATSFSGISENIIGSMHGVPGLITGLSYMFGLILGVLGVLKIKDHVENPGNTPLKEGAIRLGAGGFLLALPIVYNAMQAVPGSGTDLKANSLQATDTFGTVK